MAPANTGPEPRTQTRSRASGACSNAGSWALVSQGQQGVSAALPERIFVASQPPGKIPQYSPTCFKASVSSRAAIEALKYGGGCHPASWPKTRKRKNTRRRRTAKKRGRASFRFGEIQKGDQARRLFAPKTCRC